jgi:hypothetical protein
VDETPREPARPPEERPPAERRPEERRPEDAGTSSTAWVLALIVIVLALIVGWIIFGTARDDAGTELDLDVTLPETRTPERTTIEVPDIDVELPDVDIRTPEPQTPPQQDTAPDPAPPTDGTDGARSP